LVLPHVGGAFAATVQPWLHELTVTVWRACCAPLRRELSFELANALVRLFHPRRDKWNEHFAVAGAQVAGKSDLGRATVALLNSNDVDRIRTRDGLRKLDLWP
jgi:hypothetical protein